MEINDLLMNNSEKILFRLQELYLEAGYRPYRMSKFEEYDLYARNKDFLVSDNVITFTDTNGKLMALKPDVTLSIIKNSKDLPDTCQKVFYRENVYRVVKSTDSFREIMQTGLECFGAVTRQDVLEVLQLAIRSLNQVTGCCTLEVSNLDVLEQILGLWMPNEIRAELYRAIGEKNGHELKRICDICGIPKGCVVLLEKLTAIHGPLTETLPAIEELLDEQPSLTALADFADSLKELMRLPDAGCVQVDFSLVGDTNYYNGIVFRGFVEGIPEAVLSGGQYDKLMRKLQKKSRAIGFAVYTDMLDRLNDEEPGTEENRQSDGYLNVALPKGRLGEKVYAMFAAVGYECPSIMEQNRKLFFENPEKKVRYFWVKPSDVAIYVERGAADIGVVGKDILAEDEPDVYELLDLGIGVCRMTVAGPKGFNGETGGTLRVATKFTNVAKKYYRSIGKDIDIIHLNGSIEVAPLLGLSDVIVDIVETGTTLKENDLEVLETIFPISARLIANKSSYKFRSEAIEDIVNGFEKERTL